MGYREDSYSPHRFDITDYLVNGENLLAVKVHKFCDGTWFEDQDMIYDGGIFRDVYLVSEPLVKIEDYTVVTDLDENYKNAMITFFIDKILHLCLVLTGRSFSSYHKWRIFCLSAKPFLNHETIAWFLFYNKTDSA